MILSIATNRTAATVRLDVTGEIDIDTVQALSQAIAGAVDADAGGIEINLDATVFCACAGINALLDGRRQAVARRIGFQVINPNGNPLKVLLVLGLYALLTTRTTGAPAGRLTVVPVPNTAQE